MKIGCKNINLGKWIGSGFYKLYCHFEYNKYPIKYRLTNIQIIYVENSALDCNNPYATKIANTTIKLSPNTVKAPCLLPYDLIKSIIELLPELFFNIKK